MAPSLADEMDYFAIMGLTPDASEADIRRAHKKLSLALHPDKNRNVDAAVAAGRFSEMQLAYEVLMDPSSRLAASERRKADLARRERRDAFEGKRKKMADDLERREEEERQKRFRGVQDERTRKETLERLREEGRRLREAREKEQNELTATTNGEKKAEEGRRSDENTATPVLGALDLTVKLRFPVDMLEQLSSVSVEDVEEIGRTNTTLGRALRLRFGPLQSIVFRAPKSKKREAVAHATFDKFEDAYDAVQAGSKMKAGGLGLASALNDVWMGWSAGEEPKMASWLRDRRAKATLTTDAEALPATSEADILRRLRESVTN